MRMSQSMGNVRDNQMEPVSDAEKTDYASKCPVCERGFPQQPQYRMRFWTAALVSGVALFALLASTLSIWNPILPPNPQPKSQAPINHDAHLVGNPSSPLNGHQQWKLESHPAEFWRNELYFGEPSYESDEAWNEILEPRTFRLHRDEATRLNFTDSVLIEPGDDYAAILGVIHNLHCLRRLRQMIHEDYYYPDASQEELDYNHIHAKHCLESIRTSILCYPDLNPHPYYWSGNIFHDITVSGKVSRQCVDWKGLQELLKPRSFDQTLLMRGTGPPS